MEDLENDKIIYWFIFFGVLIFLAVIGHRYVFDYVAQKEKVNEKEHVYEKYDINDYIGVWQFFGDDDLPLQELLINVVDGSTITFDYYVNGVAYFESQTASLIDDTAEFDINNYEEFGSVKGKITFRDDKIFLVILSTDIDGVNLGTYQFNIKSEDSLLK
jgi:hypothetical protein